MDRRVVITGEAAITPIGNTKEQIVKNLLTGVSGVKAIREDAFLSKYIHSKVFGTIDYPIEYDFDRKIPQNNGTGFFLRLPGSQGLIGKSRP